MASPGSVVIQFVAKADQAARDVLGLSKSLDKVDTAASDVDGSLSKAQRQIDKTGSVASGTKSDLSNMETNLDGVGDEAEQTARRLRQSAGDMAAGIRTGATGIETETGHIKTNMRETGAEAGSEFIQNMAEGIGSGSGSVTDVVQGTLGGLTSLVATIGGPVGIAAGVAAAGVGLVFSAVTANAKKAKDQVKTLSDDLVALGETSSDAAKQQLWDDWLGTLDDGGKTVGQITDGLRDANVPAGLFKEAMTGSAGAQKQVRDLVADAIGKMEALRQKQGGLGVLDSNRLNALKQINTQLGVSNDTLSTSKDRISDIEYLTGETSDNAKDTADNLGDAADQANDLNDNLDHAARDRTVDFTVNVKNGQTMGELLGSIPHTTSSLAAGVGVTAAAAQPVVVNVFAETPRIPTSAREVVALLDGHSVRMGRKPGTPRAVAW